MEVGKWRRILFLFFLIFFFVGSVEVLCAKKTLLKRRKKFLGTWNEEYIFNQFLIFVTSFYKYLSIILDTEIIIQRDIIYIMFTQNLLKRPSVLRDIKISI